MEVERNLNDAMQVARNVMVDAMLVPGGGAVEMAVAQVRDQFSRVAIARGKQGILMVMFQDRRKTEIG